jgi:hypothetical protein
MRWMLAITMFLLCGGAEAQSLMCPASVVTKQEMPSVPAGWTLGRGEFPANLESVTFYSGPPEERASLVYDSSVKRNGLMYATWKFFGTEGVAKDKPAIWLSCNYMATNVVLLRRVASGIRECTVTYDPKTSVAMPEVRGIVCK